MDLASFIALRPYLYHLTSARNLPRIRRMRQLDSAALTNELGGVPHRTSLKRVGLTAVPVGGEVVVLRDNDVLHEGNVELPRDWAFGDLCAYLNQHVFFWPGREAGPIAYGQRHAERYAAEDLSFLRVPTHELFAANAGGGPLFAHCNSGAPRNNPVSGKPKRGPDTFRPAAFFGASPGKVVEVVFRTSARLPPSAEAASRLQGPYEVL